MTEGSIPRSDASETRDPWNAFVDSLGPLGLTLARSYANDIALRQAHARGWNTQQLSLFVSGAIGPGATNPAGIASKRLREAAGRDAPPTSVTTPTSRVRVVGHSLPWCGDCDGPRTRLTETEPTRRCECWSPVVEQAT